MLPFLCLSFSAQEAEVMLPVSEKLSFLQGPSFRVHCCPAACSVVKRSSSASMLVCGTSTVLPFTVYTEG